MTGLRIRTRRPAGATVGQRRRFTRRVVASLAVITAFLGLSLATAGTAAADTGAWKAYGNTNPITSSPSTWECASSRTIASDVIAQVCAIRSESGASAQGAVIVRNNRPSLYVMTAAVDLRTPDVILGVWHCPSSGVGANSWSVCFGKTLAHRGYVRSMASVNNTHNLGGTEWI
jgi:hypothetical protein